MEELVNVLDENGVVVLASIAQNEIPEKYVDFDTEDTGEVLTNDGDIIDVDDAVYTEDDGVQHIDNCYWCPLTEMHYHSEDEFICYNDDIMVHRDAIDSHDLVHCYYYEHYIDRDEANWCVDINEYVHENYSYWYEADDEYYYNEDEMPSNDYE